MLGLEQHPAARELQFCAILNLSRAGANKRAEQLLARFELRANLDEITERGDLEENIAALGARIDRQQAFAAPAEQRLAKLRKAAEHYDALYRQFASTFLGVNAAVLYELSGASACAKKIALSILVECNASTPRSREEAYQLEADRAAATLVLDDLEGAENAIEGAGHLAGNATSLASTRKQLLQICDHKRIDRSIVAPLRNRTVAHYTGHMIAPAGVLGRFPAHVESRVAQAIREELDRNNVGYGYGSLACGSDTLIVEALLERGAEVEVVLPFEISSFVKESVAVGGANWVDRFNSCIGQVKVICANEIEYEGDQEVFAYASRFAIGLAILRAQQLSSDLIQLAVWDGRETTDQVGTFADIRVWQRYGGKTVTIASEGNLDTKADSGHIEA
jgi:hypothetical protein